MSVSFTKTLLNGWVLVFSTLMMKVTLSPTDTTLSTVSLVPVKGRMITFVSSESSSEGPSFVLT